ncbi:hypothetical protein J2T21_003817 [Paeniglutamicibacter psychrophenolicus]|nr:hypothetical protein [Paeniglutamicibacter psychrophenolicus]
MPARQAKAASLRARPSCDHATKHFAAVTALNTFSTVRGAASLSLTSPPNCFSLDFTCFSRLRICLGYTDCLGPGDTQSQFFLTLTPPGDLLDLGGGELLAGIDTDEYLLLRGPATLPVGTIPGIREYSLWEPPMACLGATWPATDDGTSSVSRSGGTDCSGQSDGRCSAPDEPGRFNPAGVKRTLPPPGKCLRTLLGHMPRRRGRTLFRAQYEVEPTPAARPWRPRRRSPEPDHPQHPLDQCPKLQQEGAIRHLSP